MNEKGNNTAGMGGGGHVKKSAFKIAAVYFLFGILWIFFSDKILSLFVQTAETYAFAQTIKGLGVCFHYRGAGIFHDKRASCKA